MPVRIIIRNTEKWELTPRRGWLCKPQCQQDCWKIRRIYFKRNLTLPFSLQKNMGGNGCYLGWRHWNGSGSWMICVSGSERLREIDKCVVFLLTAPLLRCKPHFAPTHIVAFRRDLRSNITRVLSLLSGTWCLDDTGVSWPGAPCKLDPAAKSSKARVACYQTKKGGMFDFLWW